MARAEAALVLMEMLPPTGWGDVATRQQLEAHEIATRQQLEAVAERLDTRIDAFAERLDTKIDVVAERLDMRITYEVGMLRSDVGRMISEGQRRTLQWNVGTLIAVAGVVTAIVRIG